MAPSHLSDFGDLLLRLYRLSREQPIHLFQDEALSLIKPVVFFGHPRYLGRSLVVAHSVEHGLLFLKARPRCAADHLSPRELLVAQQLAKGSTHKQIAQTLDRSPATVRNQIQAIYEKLAVANVAGLIEALRLAA